MVEKYRKDSTNLKEHIKKLREDSIEFRSTICDTCYQPLSQPAFYYLCQHSFHQDCVRSYSDSDKDCPVCHTKNVQLLDALRAQHESRGQHESFHNLLDRSVEPFSVVSEYFGRGLFNKIVIFKEGELDEEINDNSLIEKPIHLNKQQLIQQNVEKTTNYGTGAEAKMRINEIKSQPNKIPLSEGRMRLQERNDTMYSSSLEANIIKTGSPSTSMSNRSQNRSHFNVPIAKQSSSSQQQNVIKVTTVGGGNKPSNPFDEDDDGEGELTGDGDGYNDALNPFASESNDGDGRHRVDNYDNNLNPFA